MKTKNGLPAAPLLAASFWGLFLIALVLAAGAGLWWPFLIWALILLALLRSYFRAYGRFIGSADL